MCFLLRIAWAAQGFSYFCSNFSFFFSNYVKNVTSILVRFALNLCILFGRIVTSIIFIQLIQEHERPYCSLLSSSISLQRVP